MRYFPKCQPESYDQRWIIAVSQYPRCKWCGVDSPMVKIHLCRGCNNIRREIDRVCKEQKAATPSRVFELEIRLGVLREKEEYHKADGRKLEAILRGPVTGLQLERDFGEVANRITPGKHLLKGAATELNWMFSPSQRQFLAYLCWKMLSIKDRRTEEARALISVFSSMRVSPSLRAPNLGS